jgi:ABC-2 type transport system permease protein
MASNWTVIARREFLERVRTRWFIIITLLGPIGMAGLIVVPAWLGARSANEKVTIQVVDKTGRGLYPLILSAAQSKEANFDLLSVGSPEVDERLLQERIRDEKINGYLVLPKGLLDGETAIYRGDNATNFRVKMLLTAAIHDAAVAVRAREAGIKLETIASLWTPPITVDAVHDTGHGQATSAEATFLVGYAVMFILYMSILLYAVNVMRSVVQEKTSRVVEIVISATRPGALMLGKVIGVGCVGLLQLGIWALIALLLFACWGCSASPAPTSTCRRSTRSTSSSSSPTSRSVTSSTPRSTPPSARWSTATRRRSRPRPRWSSSSSCRWSASSWWPTTRAAGWPRSSPSCRSRRRS